MATLDQNPAPAQTASQAAGGDGFFAKLLSIVMFAGLGAAIGRYLGKAAEKEGHTATLRFMTGGGAVVGALLAWSSRSQPEPKPEPAQQPTLMVNATQAKGNATQPEVSIELTQAEAQGKVEPMHHIGERTL